MDALEQLGAVDPLVTVLGVHDVLDEPGPAHPLVALVPQAEVGHQHELPFRLVAGLLQPDLEHHHGADRAVHQSPAVEAVPAPSPSCTREAPHERHELDEALAMGLRPATPGADLVVIGLLLLLLLLN